MSAIIQAPWGTATATPITQAGHGFTLGQQVYFDGTSWQLAIATGLATLRVATVAQVVDANRFLVMFEGAMQWPAHGLTLGATYYLSDATAGAITPIPPAAAASFDQPCVKPITPDFVRLIDYVIVDSAPVSAFPTGTISPYAGQTSSIQPGWLLCNGAEHSQAAYPDLFAVIGQLYSASLPTPGNFRVPDLRGRQLVMADQGIGRLSNAPLNDGALVAACPNDMSTTNNVNSLGWELTMEAGQLSTGNQSVGMLMNNVWSVEFTELVRPSDGSNYYARLRFKPRVATESKPIYVAGLRLFIINVLADTRIVVRGVRDSNGATVTLIDNTQLYNTSSPRNITATTPALVRDVTIEFFTNSNGSTEPVFYEFQLMTNQILSEGNIANDMSRMPRRGTWATESRGAHTHTALSAGSHTHDLQIYYYRSNGSNDGGNPGKNTDTNTWIAPVHATTAAGAHTHPLDSQGNHTHTISGGDYKTRPEAVTMNYLIKT